MTAVPTLSFGLLLDRLSRVQPLASAIKVDKLEAKVVLLQEVQMLKDFFHQIRTQGRPLKENKNKC